MHNVSKMNPKVFKSSMRLCGDKPRDATAIDGSINSFLGVDLMKLLDRMFEDPGGTSSMTNNLFNILTY